MQLTALGIVIGYIFCFTIAHFTCYIASELKISVMDYKELFRNESHMERLKQSLEPGFDGNGTKIYEPTKDWEIKRNHKDLNRYSERLDSYRQLEKL